MEGTAQQIIQWLFDQDKEKKFKIEEVKRKRSLDANAYCWVLCQKIAEALKTSKDEVYEQMIQRYSTFDQNGDGYITVTMLTRIPVSMLGGHWRAFNQSGEFTAYIKLKGSSEMDSKEMAHLIDGIISEAKELDIETLPPAELQKMKELWNAKHNHK